MNSRLIERLDRQIDEADDPCLRECLKAERAGVLARHGRIADARFALAGVRSQSHRLRNPALSAWVSLVEGLVEHFESVSPKAREKFLRARALAVSAGDRSLQALSAAWAANSAFNQSDYAALGELLREALALAGENDHVTRSRVSLVLMVAYEAAGDAEAAQRWFTEARMHANREGDVSMIGLLLHNLASARSGRIGLDHAFGRGDEAQARKVLLEIESGGNFDSGVGNQSLAAIVPIIRAQLFSAMDRHQDAISMFDAYLKKAIAEGMTPLEARIRADRAWCLWKVGRTTEALREARLVDGSAAALVDADDRAFAHARLAEIFSGLGRAEDATRHRALAEQALAEHQARQQELRALLAKTLAGLT
jgi:tetratricopeptide (TPR) repeat protein